MYPVTRIPGTRPPGSLTRRTTSKIFTFDGVIGADVLATHPQTDLDDLSWEAPPRVRAEGDMVGRHRTLVAAG